MGYMKDLMIDIEDLYMDGYSCKEISEILKISVKSVEDYVESNVDQPDFYYANVEIYDGIE